MQSSVLYLSIRIMIFLSETGYRIRTCLEIGLDSSFKSFKNHFQ